MWLRGLNYGFFFSLSVNPLCAGIFFFFYWWSCDAWLVSSILSSKWDAHVRVRKSTEHRPHTLMTMLRLRGVKTRLESDSTSLEVTECNQVYRQSLEQITYLQVKVIGGTSIYAVCMYVRVCATHPPYKTHRQTHTHIHGTDGPWTRVRDTMHVSPLLSFVDV